MKSLLKNIVDILILALVVTPLSLLVMYLIFGQFLFNTTVINPIDVSYKTAEMSSADTNIVLINVGNNSRQKLARQIDSINKYKPLLIAVDVFFPDNKDRLSDSLLSLSFSKVENLVLVSRMADYEHRSEEILSIQPFSKYASHGVGSVPLDDDLVVREFTPVFRKKNLVAESFVTEIVKIADTAAYSELLSRANEKEIIDFRGNIGKFYAVDDTDAVSPAMDLSFIRNKIVIFGFFDWSGKQQNDMYKTPLNSKLFGAGMPDMYGVVIHANILSQILKAKYYDKMDPLAYNVIYYFLYLLFISLLYLLKKLLPNLYLALAVVFLVVLTVFSLYLSVYTFQGVSLFFDYSDLCYRLLIAVPAVDLYLSLKKAVRERYTNRTA